MQYKKRYKTYYTHNNAYFNLNGNFADMTLYYANSVSFRQDSWSMNCNLSPNSKYLVLCVSTTSAYDNGIFASSDWDAQTMVSLTGIATTTRISNNVTGRLIYVETGESTGNVKMYHTKPSNGGWEVGGGLAVYKL